MIKLEDINKNITFEPISHTYKNESGQNLISVSTLLNLFKNPFDENGHIARAVAKRDGLQVSEVLKKWEATKNEGLVRGKSFHKQVESFIKTGKILDEDYKDVVEKFKSFNIKGKLYCEIPVHSPKYLLGGTIDLLEEVGKNTYDLIDFKTNKEMLDKSKYGKKLLYPLNNYDECPINIYTFQINLYKYILEEHGFKIKKMAIYHINPKTRNIDVYKIKNVQDDVINLLEYHKKMLSW